MRRFRRKRKKSKLVIVLLSVYAQQAEAGPPLGTILGNLGVNTLSFCKEFNEYTKELPKYIKVRVRIVVEPNRGFTFSVFTPTLGALIALSVQEKSIEGSNDLIHKCITIDTVVQLALFRFPSISLEKTVPVVLGSIKSSGLYLLYE